ncbi:Outer membrane protein OmpA [Pustulibacterium marinum]|uniref:Outer membrane protein OmpA n=1 Tax=Pustulibacterium marinum TaxID=1224947 RepID=A0A1I7IPN3_9FLAO|nr:OmpA family protein [Pustulibacterium marinum]SFU74857.1 Outer membrane protein OmpA [Pustulibacterium marinum]
MKYWLSTVLFLMVSINNAQNLIANPGFEKARISNRLSNFQNHTTDWTSPTSATPDLFGTDHKNVTTAPKNFCGFQPPRTGKKYAGIYAFGRNNYREYIQVRITDTLEKGKPYVLTYYVSLAENSNRAIKQLGVMLSDNSFLFPIQKQLTKHRLENHTIAYWIIPPVIDTLFYEDTKNWIPVRFQFTATGNEHYVTIGNFNPNRTTDSKETEKDVFDALAYYYIDDVSLYPLFPSPLPKEKKQIDTIPKATVTYALKKAYRLEKVQFAFNSTELTTEALNEISGVYAYLQAHPSLHIHIEGHTDKIGTDAYNQTLSEKRAAAVADAFIKLGLVKERISAIGFGASQPITENDTEAGRTQNRRVQFILSDASEKENSSQGNEQP